MAEKFWACDASEVSISGDVSESKDDTPEFQDYDYPSLSPTPQDETSEGMSVKPDNDELCRLPTGKGSLRLVKEKFQRLHDSSARIKETFFNLQSALRIAPKQDKFAFDWLKKMNILNAAEEKLSQVESMIMKAAGGTGQSLPVISNLATLQARNKICSSALREKRPHDVSTQRQKRKHAQETAQKKLDSLQTPLVEANRPNKKRKSEVSRNQKNYK